MPRTPLRISREPLLTSDQLEAIESTAIAILEDVGVMVGPQRLIDTMQAKGFTIRGDRVVFEPSVVREFLDAERAKPVTTPDIVSELTLGVSQYSRNYLDPETGEIQPYTTQSLIEAARIVDGLASRGVRAGAPGTPVDVHPELESVSVYHTSLTHTRHGMHPPDPRSVTAQRYLMEMADCVGYAMPLLPVYVNSPLCLAGESLDSVLAFEDRLESTWMVSMPTAGATAPIRTGEMFALSAAEVIGSAIIMREATDLEVGWGVQGFPFDMRQVSIVYGSPENLLMQFIANEVDAYLHGTTAFPGAGNIHTMAKLPGPQAAAEKSSIMTTGAMLGSRHFDCGGTLGMDEIFSPEQLVIDCEIKDHVATTIAGLDGDCDETACVEQVRQGIMRGFLGLDETLDHYRDVCWYPDLFERGLMGPWERSGGRDLREVARELVCEARERSDFELPADQQREIDRIYASAMRELG